LTVDSQIKHLESYWESLESELVNDTKAQFFAKVTCWNVLKENLNSIKDWLKEIQEDGFEYRAAVSEKCKEEIIDEIEKCWKKNKLFNEYKERFLKVRILTLF
jgi:hypothetical protein